MFYFCIVENDNTALSYGVMATQQILVLLFLVRIQVAQQERPKRNASAFFVSDGLSGAPHRPRRPQRRLPVRSTDDPHRREMPAPAVRHPLHAKRGGRLPCPPRFGQTRAGHRSGTNRTAAPPSAARGSTSRSPRPTVDTRRTSRFGSASGSDSSSHISAL